MDRPAWEPMTQQERDEWARFRMWQRYRHSDRHAVAVSQTPPEMPGTSKARRILLGVSTLLLVVTGAVALSAAESTMTGRMTVVGDATAPASAEHGGDRCVAQGRHHDIAEGAAVVVRNAGGVVVGVGGLQAGRSGSGGCDFPFTVAGLPCSERYSVQIGTRDRVSVTAAEVRNDEIRLGAN
ncbi:MULTISPECIES: hypothetical protein [Pseudonocardia]|uniref:Uncharacterized protein n=1 Tax=Pseudonocardia autotrophica TaxID=2074 RepID=A0A1Y2MXN1_PSEAH|nr:MULTISPECIES: hypothetical protein [Pseudonocardia]OSY39933.1 hypothetical protein BG845_03168 [Pseudonocardia autotrophica]TDN74529.1 hypothetical protein C8E95_3652 [Pseudonocardia autotrophica]